jgi:hypothetical protein
MTARHFRAWKSDLRQQDWGALDSILYVIPIRESVGILGPVPDKNAKVVQPRGGVDHVVIVWRSLADVSGELVKPGLVAEFIKGTRLTSDQAVKGCSKIHLDTNLHTGVTPGQV